MGTSCGLLVIVKNKRPDMCTPGVYPRYRLVSELILIHVLLRAVGTSVLPSHVIELGRKIILIKVNFASEAREMDKVSLNTCLWELFWNNLL